MKPLRLARTWLRTPRKAIYIYVSPAPATGGAQTTPKTRRLGRPDASHKVPPFPAVAVSRSSERYSFAVLCPSLPLRPPAHRCSNPGLGLHFRPFHVPEESKADRKRQYLGADDCDPWPAITWSLSLPYDNRFA